jgi:hypothetical protein
MLVAEGAQTREMMEIYGRAARGQASSADIDRANRQVGDLLRMAGLGAFFAVVPGSVLLLPLAVTAARKLGIDLLPDTWEQRTGLPVDDGADGPSKPNRDA